MDPEYTTDAFWRWMIIGWLIPVCATVFRILCPTCMNERTLALCVIFAALGWFIVMLFVFVHSLLTVARFPYAKEQQNERCALSDVHSRD